jgi:hypothetical protein
VLLELATTFIVPSILSRKAIMNNMVKGVGDSKKKEKILYIDCCQESTKLPTLGEMFDFGPSLANPE